MKPTLPMLVALLLLGASTLPFAREPVDVEFLTIDDPDAPDLPFSEAVRVDNMLFLSGQIGVEPGTMALVEGGMAAEARQTLDNVKATLERHGSSMSEVVKCTVMLADMSEWGAFNEVYVSYFDEPYPARSAFGANGLALDGSLELECWATVDR